MHSQSHRIIQKILNSPLSFEDELQNVVDDRQQQEPIEMVIELDANNSATIQIHPYDDPLTLAKTFCFQHSIDPRVISTLANNIKNVKNIEFSQQQPLINKNPKQAQNHKTKHLTTQADKQNISSIMNVFHSVNQSFNKESSTEKYQTIDKSSTMKNDTTLISNNDFSRRSVFDRLYQDSKRKTTNRNALDQSLNKNKKITKSFLNCSQMSSDPCLQIYQKNTKAHQYSLLKREQIKKENQQKLVQQCTFHPEINFISEIIAKKLPQSYPSQGKRQKDIKRIQKYLQEKEKRELAQCTFQPSILRKSRSRSKSTERYKALYEDSKIREFKRKKSMQDLEKSRKKSAVKINKISQSIVGDRTFFERLKQDQVKRQQKQEKIQYEIKSAKNPLPSTGRAPTNRPLNISIGEHLYNQGMKKSIEKQKQRQSNRVKSNKVTCRKSQQIYENVKKTAFEYIFAFLDSDEDGLISHTRINLGRLPGEVLRLLAPLLIEMQEMQAQLNEIQFIESLQRLFNSFSISEKQIILNFFKFKGKQVEEQPTFRPSLNERSISWARQNRSQKIDLYELWRETEIQKQQRLQQIRAYKVLSELEECTFHPLLFR